MKIFNRSLFLLCLIAGLLGMPQVGTAQDDDDKEKFKVETKTFEIADGLLLKCSYYPSKLGKEAVPILCIHGENGSRQDFDQFASTMQQKYGHAVIVPDLRGHGESTTIKVLGDDNKEIEAKDMNARDYQAVGGADLEKINEFLIDENNAGRLNIDRLTVVGAELGSLLAMNWAAFDWSRRQLPAFKVGQNVKAIVLLTPDYSDQGLSMATPLKTLYFQGKMGIKPSIMIVGGEDDSRAYADSKRLYSTLLRVFPEPATNEEKIKNQNLFLVPVATKLQGTKLLDPRIPEAVTDKIQGFITLRLSKKSEDFPWEERRNPLN
jgi:pimeloyl-ACP methyl ester carboxylesterase